MALYTTYFLCIPFSDTYVQLVQQCSFLLYES